MKDKRPSAASAAGQILPAISDKSSHVTQVQGSRQDQLGWYFFFWGGGGGKKKNPTGLGGVEICLFCVFDSDFIVYTRESMTLLLSRY